MDIKEALARVVDHIDLSRDEMVEVMRQVMTGECSESQIAGFLVALRMKSESIDEITGAAQVMRELATPVKATSAPLVDIVGTGGDGANLFNVSSASALSLRLAVFMWPSMATGGCPPAVAVLICWSKRESIWIWGLML